MKNFIAAILILIFLFQGDEQVANSTQKLCKGTQRDGIKSVDLLKYSDKAKESREKQAEKDKKQKSAITPKEQPKVSSEKKQLDQDKKEKSVVAAKDKEQAKGSSKVKQPDKEKKQKSVMTPKEKDQAKGTSEAKQPEKDKKEKSAEASKQKENVESRESANKKSDDVKEKTAKTFKENEKAKTPTKRSEGGGSRVTFTSLYLFLLYFINILRSSYKSNCALWGISSGPSC